MTTDRSKRPGFIPAWGRDIILSGTFIVILAYVFSAGNWKGTIDTEIKDTNKILNDFIQEEKLSQKDQTDQINCLKDDLSVVVKKPVCPQ